MVKTQRKTTARWYAETGEWMTGLNERLRERPTSGSFEPDYNDYDDRIINMGNILYRE